MADNKKSIFQRLNTIFDASGIDLTKVNQTVNKYSINNDVLLKTQSKEEYEAAKLQAQQSKFLGGVWRKTENELIQHSMHYETTRIGSYADFESMEFYPEIAAALDIMMEECLAGSTMIPLLNGSELTMKEIYDNNLTDFWVYSVDLETNKIKPSKVEKAILKGIKKVFKITLDDDTELLCTDNHKWLRYDNTWVETKDLLFGDSLKIISRKLDYKGYEKVSLTNFNADTKHTHIIVGENQMLHIKEQLNDNNPLNEKIIIHHKSFNKLNNDPNELEYMLWSEHQKLHTDLNRERWKDEEYSKKMRKIFSETAKKTMLGVDKEVLVNRLQKGLKEKLSNLSLNEQKILLNRGGKHNGMYGSNRTGKLNPNYSQLKNHVVDINETEYIKFNTTIKGNRRKLSMEKFNLDKHSVITYNKFICNKYNLNRIEDLDFIVNNAFDINKIKDYFSCDKNNNLKTYCEEWLLSISSLRRFLKIKGYNNLKDLKSTIGNHRVIKVEYYGEEEVYDLVNSSVSQNFAIKCNNGLVISHNCTTVNNKGRVLNVYSDSKRIQGILEDLFFNRLDLHASLPMWTRNIPIREDSIIPLLDGTEVTIKELSNRVKNGEEIWSYAIQDGTKAIVPSKIIWCDLTRKDSELIRVTLDDGTHIDTTPDHEYMLRDGSYKRADDLTEGQSLMPFYTLTSTEKKDKISGYEKVFNPNTNKYEYTHRIVANECVKDVEYENTINEKWLTHHINFKKKDNSPINLRRMTFGDHAVLHERASEHLKYYRNTPKVIEKRMKGIDRYLRSDKRKQRLSEEMSGIYPKYFEQYNSSDLHTEHNKVRSEKMLNNWGSKEFIEKAKKGMTIEISDACLEYISNLIVNNENYIGINKLSELLKNDDDFIQLFKVNYSLRKDIKKSINPITLNKVIFRKTNQNYFEYVLSIKPNLALDKSYIKYKSISLGKAKEKTLLNHKVVSVVKLIETSDVYCLEAVGPNGEHDRHNFPVLGKDINGSFSRTSGVFLSNCKYGDNFLLLNIDDKKGIVGARQLPNFEIERREGDIVQNQYSGEWTVNNEGEDAKVKFMWRGRDMEFNSWQIAHFRLLGDDRRLPYGTSVLEKARRIWKQLQLSEDAMLVYRVTRAPERRVYKIYVGNIDEKDVPQYVDDIANRFKRKPVIDPQTGQIDLRYNQLANDQDYFIPVRDENAATPIDTLQGACIALDTRIPLLDGRVLELNQIINEWDNGNRDLWVYSCNPITGELAPGMITWAGETRKNTEVIKITLDNGESITTTPDHKWVHRTKGFVEAKDLRVGESLMPFYRDKEYILKKKYAKKYERIWDSAKQEWVFTHRMVNEYIKNINEEQYHTFEGVYEKNKMNTIHHMDNNRFNNLPKNLFLMDSRDHYKYHRYELWSTPEKHKITVNKITKGINEYISNLSEEDRVSRGEQSKLNSINSRDKANERFSNNTNKKEIIINRGKAISISKSTKEFKEKFSEIAKSNWESNEYRDKVFSKKQTLTFTDELYTMFLEMFKLYGKADLTLNELNKSNDFMNEFINSNKDIRSSLTNLNEFTHKHLEKMLKEKDFKNYRDWCKVTAEELGYKNVRAWRYFIEKNNKEKSLLYNHKIISIEWLENKIDTGTITVDGNELYHNYHTFATESGVFIKNSNLDQIADIQYLQRKLFTALRVPKTFLGFEEAIGDGKNLAMQDIRFSRTINRIQQAMIVELNKIAIIHLYMLGFEDEISNFNLSLNNPSTQAKMLEIEQLQAKMTLYKDAVSEAGNGFMGMSMTRARRDILGWSDEEIKKDFLEQRLEKAAAAEIENTSAVIKHTGMFDEVDGIYGDINAAIAGASAGEGGEGGDSGLGGGGSFGGGGGFGGATETPEAGAETPEGSEEAIPDAGEATPEAAPEETLAEQINKTNQLLTENTKQLNQRKDKYSKMFVNRLIDNIEHKETIINERVAIYDKTLKINEDINGMINDIDNMLKD